MDLEISITVLVLLTGLALAIWANWQERKPRESFDTHLVPTTTVMFVGVLVALIAVVKLLAIFGIHLPSRWGY